MKIYRLWAILGLLLYFTSCEEQEQPIPSLHNPIACIEDPGPVTAGTFVSFSAACSQNAETYHWDFGDNTSSTMSTPSHRYELAGSYTVSLTVYKEEQESTVSKVIEVTKPEFYLHNREHINEDVTWEEGIHIIKDFVIIRKGTLTIEPGVIIKFMKDANLQVGNEDLGGSAIIANGTDAKPILFTSDADNPAPGDWQFIYIGEYAKPVSSFTHCTIEYGGNNFFSDRSGMISMKYGASAIFENCSFRHSLRYGLYLDRDSYFSSFAHNTIEEIQDYAIYMNGNHISSIGANNNIINKGISVALYEIEMDVRWEKQSCPYVMESNLWIGSEAGNTLTIAPGARLEFPAGLAVEVAQYSSYSGTLIAEGTAEDPIVFTAHDQENPSWEGMLFRPGTTAETSLKHCVIEKVGPGRDSEAVILFNGSTVDMEHCRISGSKKYGIQLDYEASLGKYAYNDIAEAGSFSMRLGVPQVSGIQEGNTFSGNKRIHVIGGRLPEGNTFWRAVEVPYFVNQRVRIGSLNGTTLTLEAGSNFQFYVGAYFDVGNTQDGKGSLIAAGTAARPITMTRAPAEEMPSYAPHWDGLWFNSDAGEDSRLEFCNISYGLTNIRLGGTPEGAPLIANCTITDASSYGLVIIGSANPTLENNSFANNGEGDIKWNTY